jgi:hypothetical protein
VARTAYFELLWREKSVALPCVRNLDEHQSKGVQQMFTSWSIFRDKCKSRMSAIARSLYLGREHWVQKYREEVASLRQQVARVYAERKELESTTARLRQERDDARHKMLDLEKQLADRRKQFQLPDDPPAQGQQYGASMMALSVNLARDVGLRKSTRAMKVFFKWLGVKRKIPSYQAVRGWMQRLGLDRMESVQRKPDRIWIVDESTQVGTDKFLTVLSIEQSKLPPIGKPLRRENMSVLAVHPSKKWNCANVEKLYKRLAERYGFPTGVITDGASELCSPVKNLEKDGVSPRTIRDLKHFLANRFERLLREDPRYQAFAKDLNQTRTSMQQTELGHLAPPKMKQKARFMNVQPLLNWAAMALWQLENPKSDGRKGVTEERLKTKLGWLPQYRQDIARWVNFQAVISAALKYMNAQGLYHGVTDELREILKRLATHSESKQLADQTIEFVRSQEQKLSPGERLPISSEILESSFGAYKQLEQQHARSGYTQLILTFPVLFKPVTAAEIQKSFSRVKVAHVQAWVEKWLPKTLDARRIAAYAEHRKAKPTRKVKICATALAA